MKYTQTKQIVALIAVVGIITLALGASLGYELSSARTTTLTETHTTSFTQILTTTQNVVLISGQRIDVVTATEKPVLVGLYTPSCETVSGQVTTVYSEVPLAETTTITLIFPTAIPSSWQQFYVTVVTNDTNVFSSHIENTTISC